MNKYILLLALASPALAADPKPAVPVPTVAELQAKLTADDAALAKAQQDIAYLNNAITQLQAQRNAAMDQVAILQAKAAVTAPPQTK
jgi:hypothetical protein